MVAKGEFFLKLDLTFDVPDKVQLFAMPVLGRDAKFGSFKLNFESRGDTEDECVERVFETAECLRDALNEFLDDRYTDHSEEVTEEIAQPE